MGDMATRQRSILILCFAVLAAAGCSSEAPGAGVPRDAAAIGSAVFCMVTAPAACPTPPIHYPDVEPIIQQNCASPCHSGYAGGPWPLTSYEHVADWADNIRSDLLTCYMPPADGGVSLPAADRLAVLTWIRCGYPE
jgi:hypothetical protein